jgi:DNA-binding NarL/FixJ family response regulator
MLGAGPFVEQWMQTWRGLMAKAMTARAGAGVTGVTAAIWAANNASGAGKIGSSPDVLAVAVLAALETALEALRAPALIVGQGGDVVCGNAAARTLMAEQPRVAFGANKALGQRWEVTPIRGAGARGWSLAILRRSVALRDRDWKLTERQSEVMDLVVRGMTNTSIAETLAIGLGTVEFHISRIFNKVGVDGRAALIARVFGR